VEHLKQQYMHLLDVFESEEELNEFLEIIESTISHDLTRKAIESVYEDLKALNKKVDAMTFSMRVTRYTIHFSKIEA
jgi:hypothetical protein